MKRKKQFNKTELCIVLDTYKMTREEVKKIKADIPQIRHVYRADELLSKTGIRLYIKLSAPITTQDNYAYNYYLYGHMIVSKLNIPLANLCAGYSIVNGTITLGLGRNIFDIRKHIYKCNTTGQDNDTDTGVTIYFKLWDMNKIECIPYPLNEDNCDFKGWLNQNKKKGE